MSRMHRFVIGLSSLFALFGGGASVVAAPQAGQDAPDAAWQALPPSPVRGLSHDAPFFPGAAYDPTVPAPESVLGYRPGDRAATHAEIERCLQAWSKDNPRTRLVNYTRSHEGRALYYLVISSPENMRRLDEIRDGLGKLADPRGVDPAEAERLAETLPAVGWFAYGIHGDENSPCDGALAVAYHLAACTDEEVRSMLEELIIIIDPLQNPDGHDRFLKQVREHAGNVPNVDDQSLLHSGYWPWGRTNHYNFDLNRDWILCVHPETRGRVKAVGEWHPVLFIDGHEMGSQDTFLFSPSREPINPNIPAVRKQWWNIFARDQASAFDAFGWRYYAGEWNEEWYPGYSSSWAGYRGAVGILYEQASIGHDGVRRPEGTIVTYREATHRQVVSTMANIRTLRSHRVALMKGFLAERRAIVAPEGPYASTVFAIPPSPNRSRLNRLLEILELQGIEVFSSDSDVRVPTARDRLGRDLTEVLLPRGTLFVPTRQPEGHLAAAILEFDPRMTNDFLREERQELLRFGRSRLYDVTAWNLTMLFDLPALALSGGLPAGAKKLAAQPSVETPPVSGATGSWTALVIDGADDASVFVAARLMERGAQVRVSDREFAFDGTRFARGSVVVTREDNRLFEGGLSALASLVEELCAEAGASAVAVASGLGMDGQPDPVDIGGEHFIRLETPRIAVLSRAAIDFYDFGSIRHLFDHRMGIRASYLSLDDIESLDLRRYNVIVAPGGAIDDASGTLVSLLKPWVEQGGTLIATADSAAALAFGPPPNHVDEATATEQEPSFSAVRQLRDVLADTSPYELAIIREWEGRKGEVDPDAVWSQVAPTEVTIPWEDWMGDPVSELEEDERIRRDEWRSLFMPQGAIVAARCDDRHWLTFGSTPEGYMPVLFGDAPVLMSAPPVEAPVRIGFYTPARSAEAAAQALQTTRPSEPGGEAGRQVHGAEGSSVEEKPAPPRVGWAPLPPGQELRLRMSGLLWPEAAQRIANAAYVTRESVGRGQVILFATAPVFRGSTLGTARIFANAAVYGPGFGASHPIEP